ncbi:divergent polysaccharide deacetylase family protein [Xenorhabdus griffiniae]|uniref:divergent polysaccharide deacetylase family protein n=1 Tax=Xenorhabdus griffiniae TaxID=351672 RepID=UPI002358FB3E|nr:divergent polysaccharide deacetylase family protein [Xenorhabdus griffiniae]MDC9603980.1 divergent polysaccharide deacetylase family protein [Xenorhabdus griffiniae]
MVKMRCRLIKQVNVFTFLSWIPLFFTSLLFALNAQAARLAIVIDDVGYRVNEENKILQMPVAVSIAILPNSPYGRKMAGKAYQQGREILIHLPMAPLGRQPLEKNTLHPAMDREEIARIIQDAIQKVPHAVGMNNHMGSAMTSNLSGMEKVMQALSHYHLYFLDSVTIGNTQVTKAAMGTPVPVIRRNVFLDNIQTEAETRHQLNRAISLARKRGSAVAIGHPYPTTIRALQQALATLPGDIELVTPSLLLDHQTARKCIQPHEPKPAPATQLEYLKMVKKALSSSVIFNAFNRYMQKLLGNYTTKKTPDKTEVKHTLANKTETRPENDQAGIQKTKDACANF